MAHAEGSNDQNLKEIRAVGSETTEPRTDDRRILISWALLTQSSKAKMWIRDITATNIICMPGYACIWNVIAIIIVALCVVHTLHLLWPCLPVVSHTVWLWLWLYVPDQAVYMYLSTRFSLPVFFKSFHIMYIFICWQRTALAQVDILQNVQMYCFVNVYRTSWKYTTIITARSFTAGVIRYTCGFSKIYILNALFSNDCWLIPI